MTPLAIYVSTFTGCLIGGFVPLVNIELLLLSAAALTPVSFALPLVLIATVAQMLAKSVLYLAGTGALRLPGGWLRKYVTQTAARVALQQRAGGAVVFSSALLALPPLTFVSIASGMLGLRFPVFLLFGSAGRLLRASVLVFAPHLVRHLVA